MTLQTRLAALVQAIGADIKLLKSSPGGTVVQQKNPSAIDFFLNPANGWLLRQITTSRNNSNNWIVYSGVSDNKAFIVLGNGMWIVMPKSSSDTVYTGALPAMTYSSGGYANSIAFAFPATAGLSMGSYAATTSIAAPTFTTLAHPRLNTKWSAVAYNAGVYVFVGKDGNITATKDFITFTDSVAESGAYHLTDVAYNEVLAKFVVVGVPTSATYNTVRNGANSVYMGKFTINVDTGAFSISQVAITLTTVDTAGTDCKITCDPLTGDALLSIQDIPNSVHAARLLRYARSTDGLSFLTYSNYGFYVNSSVNFCDTGSYVVLWSATMSSFVIHPIKYREYAASSGVSLCYIMPSGWSKIIPSEESYAIAAMMTALSFNDGIYVQIRLIGPNVRFWIYDSNNPNDTSLPLVNGVALNSARYNGLSNKNALVALGTRQSFTSGLTMNTYGEVTQSTNTVNGFPLTSWSLAATNQKGIVQSSAGGNYVSPAVSFWAKGCIYFEFEYTGGTPHVDSFFGVVDVLNPTADLMRLRNQDTYYTNIFAICQTTGELLGRNPTVTVPTVGSYTTSGDVISVAVDFDNNTIWVKKNNGDWNGNPSHDPSARQGGITFVSDGKTKLASFYLCASSPLNGNLRVIPEHLKYTVPFGFRLPETAFTNSDRSVIIPPDVTIMSPEQGQRLMLDGGVFRNKYDFEVTAQNTVMTNPDSFGVYTTITRYWPSKTPGVNGPMFMTSVLSNGTAPFYTTRTETYYRRNGAVYDTAVYTLEYSNGVCVKETKQ